jgi:RNase P subunit RPR2
MRKRKYHYQLVISCPTCETRKIQIITTRDRFKSGVTEHLSVKCLYCLENPPVDWLLAQYWSAKNGSEL